VIRYTTGVLSRRTAGGQTYVTSLITDHHPGEEPEADHILGLPSRGEDFIPQEVSRWARRPHSGQMPLMLPVRSYSHRWQDPGSLARRPPEKASTHKEGSNSREPQWKDPQLHHVIGERCQSGVSK